MQIFCDGGQWEPIGNILIPVETEAECLCRLIFLGGDLGCDRKTND